MINLHVNVQMELNHVSVVELASLFCETQCRQSVKTRLYNTPGSVKTKAVKVIEFHRIGLT